jgi:hypothetical protein
VFAVDAADGVVDHRMIAGERVVGQAMVLADRGKPLCQRGAAEESGQAGEVFGDRLGRGRQRGQATQLAPLGKGLPAGLVGAQRRRRERRDLSAFAPNLPT